MTKRGQFTLYFIIGIVLLIVVAGTIYVISNMNRQKFKSDFLNQALQIDDFYESLEYTASMCTESAMEKELDYIMANSGQFSGTYPSNTIYHDGRFVGTVYDINYPDIIGMSKEYYEEQLSFIMSYAVPECMDNMYEAMSEKYGYYEVTFNQTNVSISDAAVLTQLEYVVDKDKMNTSMKIEKVVQSDLKYFIDKVNEIVITYLQGEYNSDQFFNQDMCQAISAQYDFKPRYSLDFLKSLALRPDIIFDLRENYFIFYITKSDTTMTFGINPQEVIPAC